MTKKNGTMKLINASTYLDKIILCNTLPYIVSDSENSLAKINDYYFALATITSYQNSYLIITVLNIYNNDNSLVVDYFVLPWKDLNDINYYSNLQSFGYKNTLGIQFEHKKGNEYRSGFIIFGFGNSTDIEIVNNIFSENDKYILNPGKYIKVQNNIFCYRLLNIILTEIPDSQSLIPGEEFTVPATREVKNDKDKKGKDKDKKDKNNDSKTTSKSGTGKLKGDVYKLVTDTLNKGSKKNKEKKKNKSKGK